MAEFERTGTRIYEATHTDGTMIEVMLHKTTKGFAVEIQYADEQLNQIWIGDAEMDLEGPVFLRFRGSD